MKLLTSLATIALITTFNLHQISTVVAEPNPQVNKSIESDIERAISLTKNGVASIAKSDFKTARQQLLSAVNIWESISTGKANQTDITRTYQQLQKALVAQQDTNTALEINERSQARTTAELYSSIVTNSQAFLPKQPLLPRTQTVARTRNTTILVYSIVDRDLYTWAIAPTGKTTFKQTNIPANINVKQLASTIRQKFAGRENPDAQLSQLSAILLTPITDLLPKNSDLISIVPPPELLSLPFAALKTSSGKYLIVEHPIEIAASLRALTKSNLGTSAARTPSPLVVGNPLMPKDRQGQSLSSLPGAEIEAKAIAQIWQTEAISGAAATRERILQKMRLNPIAHLATWISFTGSSTQPIGEIALANGWLTTTDLFRHSLNTKNLILSGAISDNSQRLNEGMMMLSQAGIRSGIGALTLNLWEFGDDAPNVKLILTEFHRRLSQGDLDRAAVALRAAMLTTMKTYPEPNSWALFTVMQ
jgi:CHAT domain-containing protein